MNSKISYNDSEPLWHCGSAAPNGSPCIRRLMVPSVGQHCDDMTEVVACRWGRFCARHLDGAIGRQRSQARGGIGKAQQPVLGRG